MDKYTMFYTPGEGVDPTGEAPSVVRAVAAFRQHGGTMRTREALRAGISPRTLYRMREAGILDRLSRGVYRLADTPTRGDLDLIAVSARVPRAVVCLVSALAYHELTTEIPHQVYIAIEKGTSAPTLGYPPIRVFWFGGMAYTEGIEEHAVDGVSVRVYAPEKSIADAFKFRNTVGLDVALDALRLYRRRRPVDVGALLRFAHVCRVERVMRPYLEAVL